MLEITPTQISVEIAPDADFKYSTTFIGDSGRVLATLPGRSAKYDLVSDQSAVLHYVRARIEDSGGRRAWTQPVFIRP